MSEEVIYPPCKKCGSSHGMGFENRETGKIDPIDLCRDCLFGKKGEIFSPLIIIEELDKFLENFDKT